MIYEPREDSYLLLEQVKRFAKGKVLDIGTGSGIQVLEAAKKKNVKEVVGADIQKSVIRHCKEEIKNKKIKFRQSNLFAKIKKKYDTIIFNPPYLPEDIRVKDITLEGGKKGYEIFERFFADAGRFLADEGIILVVFSSLTNKRKVDDMIRKNNFRFKQLSKKHIFFEDLYVYMVEKEVELPNVKGLANCEFFAKGHRGILYKCRYKGKTAVIKMKRPESKAVGRMKNEGLWLKRLNKHKIGPKLFKTSNEWFIYEYISGVFIPEFVEGSDKTRIQHVLKNVFNQCFTLDKLKVDKEEMHHPYKHIIVGKKVVLVDFERAHKVKKGKNVTQFCQYIISGKFGSLLKKKGFKISRKKVISLAKKYKKEQSRKNFEDILEELS